LTARRDQANARCRITGVWFWSVSVSITHYCKLYAQQNENHWARAILMGVAISPGIAEILEKSVYLPIFAGGFASPGSADIPVRQRETGKCLGRFVPPVPNPARPCPAFSCQGREGTRCDPTGFAGRWDRAFLCRGGGAGGSGWDWALFWGVLF
jgi:hypothetical protein